MFLTIAIILLVLWALGFFAFHVAGGLYSFNYDRRLNNSVSLRGGLSRWTSVAPLGDQPKRHYTFHLMMVNGLFGDAPNFFELGAGARFGSFVVDGATNTAPRRALK